MARPFPLGKRVVVVGDSGSGKSVVADRLAKRLGVQPIELDALYWGPDWTPVELKRFCERVEAAVHEAEWVLVGNYASQQMTISWPRADSIVWLDFPLRVTVPRMFMRSYRRWRSGEHLWGGNLERFWSHFMLWSPSRSLVTWTLTNHRTRRRRYEAAMDDPAYAHVSFHRLRSQSEVDAWMTSIGDR